mmetsp:Transcript_25848/g.41800  ORF Transcript_25848/g.41800 Transcript_25848/m.41800 type:complete len:570 (-) Transcript_25848:573-2282(-)
MEWLTKHCADNIGKRAALQWAKNTQQCNVVIMGAGRLGQSLTTFNNYEQLQVVGVFDSDPTKIGLRLGCGVIVEGTDKVKHRVQELDVFRAIIAVPPPAAQNAADQLVQAGIKMIISYAPVTLSVPLHVVCERIDPVMHFARLQLYTPFVTSLLTNYETDHTEHTKENKQTFSPLQGVSLSFPLYLDYLSMVQHPEYLASLAQPTEKQTDDTKNDNSFFTFLQHQRDGLDKEITNPALSPKYKNDKTARRVRAASPALTIHGQYVSITSVDQIEENQNRPSTAPERNGARGTPVPTEYWRVQEPPSTRFSSLFGLNDAREQILEVINACESKGTFEFSGILLYGPPGCGKSSLTNAITAEKFEQFRFYQVSAADLTSSLLAELCQLASCTFRDPAPAIIYIDAIDVLCKSQHLKSELLKQFDTLPPNVIIMGGTTLPWEIDIALLRHFERRVAVKLPKAQARKSIFCKAIESRGIDIPPEKTLLTLASITKGYTAPDIVLVVKDALLKSTREGMPELDFLKAVSHVKPTISKEIIALYTNFADTFGNSSPLYGTSQSTRPMPPYMSLYC